MIKIDKKITAYKVKTEESPEKIDSSIKESIKRPTCLESRTYKLKPPSEDSAIYVTISRIEIGNEIHPFEIFFSSKNSNHEQWMKALSRLISAIFRKGGDVTFIIEELEAIADPSGGYWQKGKFFKSLIHGIGDVLKQEFEILNLISKDQISEEISKILEKKKEEANSKGIEANLCSKCGEKAVILMDGCLTCTSCGDSKCG